MRVDDWYRDVEWLDYRGQYSIPLKRGGRPGAPRLLLIHGFPTASWDWFKIWPALGEHFELACFDLIGFGVADKPRQYDYSLLDQASLTEFVTQSLSWTNCFVLAHDYGDSVAQELLARQSDGTLAFQIDRCVLLNGGIIPEAHRPTLVQRLLMTPLGPLISLAMNRRKLGQIFHHIFGPQTPPSDDEITACWQLIKENGGNRISHKLIRYMAERKVYRDRWVSVLQRPPVPVRLIDGLLDPISGAHLVEGYRRLAPDADIVELPDIGHYPQLEAPDRVIKHVVEFLANS